MKKLSRNLLLVIFSLMLLIQCTSKKENARSILNFGKDWRFQLGDISGAEEVKFDDSSWRKLNVPHD